MAKGLPKTMKNAQKAGTLGNGTAVATVTTANATDLTTAQALANANKAKINELIGVLKAAGICK